MSPPASTAPAQVTVTDEDTQSQVELDFNTPTPPHSEAELLAVKTGSFEADTEDEEEEDFFVDDPPPVETKPPVVVSPKPPRVSSPIGGRTFAKQPSKDISRDQNTVNRHQHSERLVKSASVHAEAREEASVEAPAPGPRFPVVRQPLPSITRASGRAGLKSSPVTGRRKPPRWVDSLD